MASELDISQAARTLLKLHGPEAGAVAMKRADLRMFSGDRHGMLAWSLIAERVEELRSEAPEELGLIAGATPRR
jgi:hypothetical protein